MVRLSVNINKVALIRNSRGGNRPDLIQVARDCERFGAQGITVHPRPDERHIRYSDIGPLKTAVKTEFNIEGNPTPRFMELVLRHRPHQCTLVPDVPSALTSDSGWDTAANKSFLQEICQQLREADIRSSLFVDPDAKAVEGAAEAGADRIELYTGPYAHQFANDPTKAIEPYVKAAAAAQSADIGINAGHDLDLRNLRFFRDHISGLLEVSIGHALICDALYYGLQNVILMYRNLLKEVRS
jgi:pyridoxine 5-phosphate synthase